jgi:hypothetical protein
MAPLIRAEAFYRKVIAERPEVDKHAIVFAGKDIPQIAFSIGAVHLVKERAVILIWDWSSTPQQRADAVAQTPITYAFVPAGDVKDPACTLASDPVDGIVLVRFDAKCLARAGNAQ